MRQWDFRPMDTETLLAVENREVRPFTNRYYGKRVSYEEMALRAAEFRPTEYAFFPGVCPGWDNEARRPNRGMSFVGTTPQTYGAWLESACRNALGHHRPDERLVFVNAWNEWAEGAHLEPDRHFGYAYLNETGRVISGLGVAGPNVQNIPSVQSSKQLFQVERWVRKVVSKSASALEKLAMLLRSI